MQIHQHAQPLRRQIAEWKQQGERIALVPTMGNLHAGHLSLIDRLREYAGGSGLRTIVSIYVNPLQFGENEDFDTYPRTLEADCEQLRQNDVDMIYIPNTHDMYPDGLEATTRVLPPAALGDVLEGESRPGFFTGVTTVVNKLFNMVQPDMACFGEKDYQQLLVIRRMVQDFALPVEIISAPIMREPDGLAMSSRNRYLDAGERDTAAGLQSCLQQLVAELQQLAAASADLNGDSHYAVAHATSRLERLGFMVDYVVVRRQQDLAMPQKGDRQLVALAAVWLGKTRLIDNICFEINSL